MSKAANMLRLISYVGDANCKRGNSAARLLNTWACTNGQGAATEVVSKSSAGGRSVSCSGSMASASTSSEWVRNPTGFASATKISITSPHNGFQVRKYSAYSGHELSLTSATSAQPTSAASGAGSHASASGGASASAGASPEALHVAAGSGRRRNALHLAANFSTLKDYRRWYMHAAQAQRSLSKGSVPAEGKQQTKQESGSSWGDWLANHGVYYIFALPLFMDLLEKGNALRERFGDDAVAVKCWPFGWLFMADARTRFATAQIMLGSIVYARLRGIAALRCMLDWFGATLLLTFVVGMTGAGSLLLAILESVTGHHVIERKSTLRGMQIAREMPQI